MPEGLVSREDIERYHGAVAYIDSLAEVQLAANYLMGSPRPSIFLNRTTEFLRRLGNPQDGFKYIHIAGTSGKGTTVAMVHNALHAAGKRVGSFTSPYVTSAIEKIRVGELYIAPGEFADIVEELKPLIEEIKRGPQRGRPSYFEIFFAIALMYFKRQKCEWVVLEVGLGGRYDATNVIKHPVVTAVTNIDYDHVHLLGKTLFSIADNKIGIVKKGSEFFTTEKRPALLRMFRGRCEDVGARFHALPVHGNYQENNKRLARAICQHIGISEEVASSAIEKTRLPCRFEVMQENPLIILDGAHNRAKMRSTVTNLKGLEYNDLHLVIGISATKDVDVILKEIIPLAGAVHITSFDRSLVVSVPPGELLKAARKYAKPDVHMALHNNPENALRAAQNAAKKGNAILATGSFYLCGALRERWYSEEWVLKNRRSF